VRSSAAQTAGLLAPALLLVLATGAIPMGFVVFYSLHDTFAGNDFVFVGLHWFGKVLSSGPFWSALGRSLIFSALVLAVQIPLGIYVALHMPAKGPLASVLLVLMAIPLLTPTLVVGYLWKAMTLPKAGLLFEALQGLGLPLDMNNVAQVWAVLLLMDTWHWTSLVVLLCYAALSAIPEEHYRAARIDGARPWAVFRYVQWPRLRLVLLIAVLLRFMDSFMVYTETYVITRGGPGVSTTFLSHELVQTALIQFDLGEGAAISLVYFVLVAAVSWFFYRLIVPREQAQ
jgi:glycerol transport system permease protein